MAEISDSDREAASAAGELLDDQGHSGLSMSPEKMVRWYGDGVFTDDKLRGGRGLRRTYPTSAPEVAAALAVALSQSKARERRRDLAVLTVFGEVPIATGAVKTAYGNVYRLIRKKLLRTQIPGAKRSERLALPDHERAGDPEVKGALVGAALGYEPNQRGLRLLVERILGPGALDDLGEDVPLGRLRDVVARVSLDSLTRTAQDAPEGLLVWAVQTTRALMDFLEMLAEYIDRVGVSGALPAQRLLVRLARAIPLRHPSRAAMAAIVAPVWLVLDPESKLHAEIEYFAAACRNTTPKLRAAIRVAEEIPTRWLPSLGFNAAAFIFQLPEAERDELFKWYQTWARQHPDLLVGGDQARAALAKLDDHTDGRDHD